MTSLQSLSQADAERILSYTLSEPSAGDISQVYHRINLINDWSIKSGDKVLEIGCGQGLCTTVLAAAVGSSGQVDAIDPGPLDYGAPLTLGQAQEFIKKSEVGQQITFHQADPIEFVQTTEGQWDVAVLSHCIWYFENPGVLKEMLQAFKGKVHRICIAEYALSASRHTAVPHVLAAVGRGLFESQRDDLANVKTPLSPRAIKAGAESRGWKVMNEKVIIPPDELQDGYWEVRMFMYDKLMDEVAGLHCDDKIKQMIITARDTVIAAHDGLNGEHVTTMDVWVANLEPDS